jgi:deoxyxylulose-5-phosphate synthase
MSISRSVGALSVIWRLFAPNPGIFRMKDITEAVIKSIPLVGVPLRHFISESKSALKHVLYPETFLKNSASYIWGLWTGTASKPCAT